MEEYNAEENKKEELSRGQKLAVGFLSLFGVFVIVFWGITFKQRLTDPFAYNGTSSDNTNNASSCTGENCEAEKEKLLNKDTDQDGLNDWEELYTYGTSPYLEDSDSDGIADYAEIKSDSDPNCPKGQDCSTSVLANDNEAIDTGADSSLADYEDLMNQLEALGEDTGTSSESSAAVSEADAQKIISGEADAATLRKMLLDYGMDEATLNQISDTDLMASFKEILSQGE